jgi:hypothetical protein
VPVIGRWDGYSAPSPVVLALTFFLVANMMLVLAVRTDAERV